MFAALYLYLWEYGKSGNPLHLRGLFSLFYVGGEGISCLKLSNLQKDWSLETWACFFVAFAAFWNVYALAEKKFGYGKEKKTVAGFSQKFTEKAAERYGTRIFIALTGLTILSLTAFLFEAFRLGYVPFLLRGVPHAYSYFHISGVHYVTVSCVLVPSMEVLLWFYDREMGKAKKAVSLIMAGAARFVPGRFCSQNCGDSRSVDIYDRQRTQENQVSFHGSGGTCSTLCDLNDCQKP